MSTPPAGELRILVSRHSAFYSPLIATIAGGFLEREGLSATYGVLAPGETSSALIRGGRAHVIQSAVSSNWLQMEKGATDLPVHFAQINQRDGFFLAARVAAPAFDFRELEGRTLLADHATQPLAMLRYALRRQGVDWSKVNAVDAGAPDSMEARFRDGEGDYVHLQAPAPHQLERDGAGVIVASIGEAMPTVAFSSLTASREFVVSDTGRAFLAAYARARQWARSAPAAEVTAAEQPFFPNVDTDSLARAIGRYQALGCWDGGLAIERVLYEQALEVFLSVGVISRRHAYEEVVVSPE